MSFVLASLLDSESGRNLSIVYSPDDMEMVYQYWTTKDVILRDIQHLKPFAGRLRWCDLTPTHIRFMLTQQIENVFKLLRNTAPSEMEPDALNERDAVKSMNFLMMAFIHSFNQSTGSIVENIRAIRHMKNEVTLNIVSSTPATFVDLGDTLIDDAASMRAKPSLRLLDKDTENNADGDDD